MNYKLKIKYEDHETVYFDVEAETKAEAIDKILSNFEIKILNYDEDEEEEGGEDNE